MMMKFDLTSDIDVLLLDDEKNFLDLTESYLKKEEEKFNVKAFSSPQKALSHLKEQEYDCIVCDYQMPEMDGLEVLENVKERNDIDSPFIMFTGKGKEEIAIKALNLGADRYIKKTGDPKIQFEVLAQAILQESRIRRNLNRQKKFLSELFKSSPEAIVLVNKKGEIIKSNKKFKELFQYIGEKIKYRNLNDLVSSPKKIEEVQEIFNRTLHGEIIKTETTRSKKDGTTFPVSLVSYPIKSGDEIIGTYGIYRDISDRKEEEKKLQEMLDGTPDVIGFQEPNHDIIRYNKAGYELFDASPEEVRKSKCYELLGRKEECEKCVIKDAIESKKMEKLEKYQSEINKYFESTANPVLDDDEEVKYVIEHVRDITERKEKEKELKEIKEKMEVILNNAPEIVFEYDSEGNYKNIYTSNPNLLAGEKKEMIGNDLSDFLSDSTAKKIKETIKKALETKEQQKTTFKTQLDGEERWFSEHITPINQKENDKVISISSDITKIKKTEEREKFLHTLLRHDLKNKIQIISGYIELLKEKTSKNKKYTKKALRACEKSREIIKKIKTLREIPKEEITEKDLRKVLNKVLEEEKNKAQERGIEIIKEKVPQTKVKGGQLLNELFSNLIGNSIKHSEGSKIKIDSKTQKEEITVIIEDDGKGIPSNKKQKIFEKGYTKGEEGSGLGLFLVNQITENYDGSIEVSDSN